MSKSVLAVHRGDDGLFSVAWAGGVPVCVSATRDEAAAALRDASDFPESEIQAALDNPQASASAFIATALEGTANEFDGLADAVSELPTTDEVSKVAARVEAVGAVLAALADTVSRQEKNTKLAELEKQSQANLQRKFDSLADMKLKPDERAGVIAHHNANDWYALRVAELRRELAQ